MKYLKPTKLELIMESFQLNLLFTVLIYKSITNFFI
jgi:hypothetical protein